MIDLRHALGGRWLVSWRRSSLLGVVALVGAAPDAVHRSGDAGLALLLAVAAGVVVNYAIDFALHLGPWADRAVRPVRPTWAITRFALGGVVYALTIESFERLHAVELPAELWRGLIIYPLVAVWLNIASISLAALWSEARELRTVAVTERIAAMATTERAQQVVAELTAQIDLRLAEDFGELRAELSNVAGDSASADVGPSVSAAIRKVADHSVRATGHELWRQADGDIVHIDWRDVARDVVMRQPFRPMSIIGFSILMPLLGSVSVDAFWAVMAISGLAAAVVAVECGVANAVMRRWPVSRPVVVPLVIAAFVAGAEVGGRLGTAWGLDDPHAPLPTVIVLTVALYLTSSVLGSYRDLGAERVLAIASSIREGRLIAVAEAQAVSAETRRLAQLLHGNVQSRLLGCAMAVEFAGDDPTRLRQAVDRTLTVLERGWRDEETAAAGDGPSLAALCEMWSGIAEVTVTVEGEVPESSASRVAIVGEELVANAVRHGRARHVDVSVTVDDQAVTVQVSDDGTGGDDGEPGLGSRIVEQLGALERSSTESGMRAVVRLGTD